MPNRPPKATTEATLRPTPGLESPGLCPGQFSTRRAGQFWARINTQRNLELIWLTGRLTPDFKTIADFRRDHGAAITAVCSQFVELCRSMNVFSHAVVAIDGSKVKGVNNRDRNFTVGKIKARRKQLDESVARYLAELDRADRDPSLLPEGRIPRLKVKLATVREQMARLDVIEQQLEQIPDHQLSLTDPDARSMASSGRGTGTVGYNVQAAVDAEHHLIVAHEVTNVGNDRAQLSPMAKKARDALGVERMTALADRGYYSAKEILACEDAASSRWFPSHSPPAARRTAGSTSATSSMTRPPTNTNVRRASVQSTGSSRSSTD